MYGLLAEETEAKREKKQNDRLECLGLFYISWVGYYNGCQFCSHWHDTTTRIKRNVNTLITKACFNSCLFQSKRKHFSLWRTKSPKATRSYKHATNKRSRVNKLNKICIKDQSSFLPISLFFCPRSLFLLFYISTFHSVRTTMLMTSAPSLEHVNVISLHSNNKKKLLRIAWFELTC